MACAPAPTKPLFVFFVYFVVSKKPHALQHRKRSAPLDGDRLAMSVCVQKTIETFSTFPRTGEVQTDTAATDGLGTLARMQAPDRVLGE